VPIRSQDQSLHYHTDIPPSQEDRIPALEDTLERVLKFATLLSSAGISVRVLNGGDDSSWNGLTRVSDVMKKMSKVHYGGWTRIGDELWHKILTPLVIKKAKKGELKRPLMVIIITDGEVWPSLVPVD
jgi:hypothetical protein